MPRAKQQPSLNVPSTHHASAPLCILHGLTALNHTVNKAIAVFIGINEETGSKNSCTSQGGVLGFELKFCTTPTLMAIFIVQVWMYFPGLQDPVKKYNPLPLAAAEVTLTGLGMPWPYVHFQAWSGEASWRRRVAWRICDGAEVSG